jgi:structural toxin protein (hemagglutinin/hemolysin) RtxA
MYQLSFYVPEAHLEKVKECLFENGAGRIGAYERCAWQVKGEGQFYPKADSNPYTGERNKLEKISEYKVEMVCENKHIKKVIAALKAVHPYEEPAYSVVKLEN